MTNLNITQHVETAELSPGTYNFFRALKGGRRGTALGLSALLLASGAAVVAGCSSNRVSLPDQTSTSLPHLDTYSKVAGDTVADPKTDYQTSVIRYREAGYCVVAVLINNNGVTSTPNPDQEEALIAYVEKNNFPTDKCKDRATVHMGQADLRAIKLGDPVQLQSGAGPVAIAVPYVG